MGILRRDGNDQRQRRGEQTALSRSEQPQLVRDPFQMMTRDPLQMFARDPFQMFARDPFQLMREMMMDPFRMFQQMAPLSDIGREGRDVMWMPTFEVRESDDAFVFKADMAGVRDADLDISLTGNNLVISGKRERDVEQDEGTVHLFERSYGQFTRSFSLPDTADLDQVRSELKDGVLTLIVPKRPGTTPQRRKIQIGGGTKA